MGRDLRKANSEFDEYIRDLMANADTDSRARRLADAYIRREEKKLRDSKPPPTESGLHPNSAKGVGKVHCYAMKTRSGGRSWCFADVVPW